VSIVTNVVDAIWHGLLGSEAEPPNPFPELAGFVGLAVAIVAAVAAGRTARGAMTERRLERSPQGR